MRALLGFVAAVLILALVGWISFSSSSDQATVNIEKEKIKQDTAEIVEATKNVADDIANSAESASENIEE